MNITTQSQGFETTHAIDGFARDSLYSALRQFSDSVVSVDVHMKDTNGPKGGVDKCVVIRVRLPNRQAVTLETRHKNLYAALRAGSKRVRRAVRRHLRKARHIKKVRISGRLPGSAVPAAS